jgi:2-dehydro-3-deoxyphosphogluconate aldolase / (4S)-4-hydroxy-2-oxoglutarate aldolase
VTTRPEVPRRLEASRVIAILRRTDADVAVDTAQALLAGGIDTLEVTCDSPGAFDILRAIAAALGDRVLLGAGTVLDSELARAALDAGAKFLVSPHLDAELVFPSGAVGPGYIKDILGPLRHIPLLPTGGVTLDNAAAFLSAGAWGLGMGSALVDSQIIAQRRFDELQARAARLAGIVAAARG